MFFTRFIVHLSLNRYAARQLRDRCHNLVLSLREYEVNAVSDNMAQARNTVHELVPRLYSPMSRYTKHLRLKAVSTISTRRCLDG